MVVGEDKVLPVKLRYGAMVLEGTMEEGAFAIVLVGRGKGCGGGGGEREGLTEKGGNPSDGDFTMLETGGMGCEGGLVLIHPASSPPPALITVMLLLLAVTVA